MTVTIYKSTDGSAPTLSGTAGDLINVLDKVLVTGYGAQTAAGWTKPFTGTNGASFLQGTGSNGYYLNVNDNAPGAGTGKEARVVGYESMTAFATGLSLFPTAAQFANGLFVRKSTSADAVTRPWIIAADQRTFYMFVLTGDTAGTYYAWSFGEYYSVHTSPAADTGRTYLMARNSENGASSGNEALDLWFGSVGSANFTGVGKTLVRGFSQGAGAITNTSVGVVGDAVTGNNGGGVDFPNTVDGRIYISPLRILEADASVTTNASIRGHHRGLWFWSHSAASASDADTFTGAGDLAGKSFLVIKSSARGNLYIIETSNTWDTN